MKRGFSLIEAMVVTTALGLAIPPSLMLLQDAANVRADAVSAARAASLAEAALEFIVADTASRASGLGFDALADATAYVEHPTEGVRARMQSVLIDYRRFDLEVEIDISDLVSWKGETSDDGHFRIVTVRVAYPLSTQSAGEVSLSAMVSRWQ